MPDKDSTSYLLSHQDQPKGPGHGDYVPVTPSGNMFLPTYTRPGQTAQVNVHDLVNQLGNLTYTQAEGSGASDTAKQLAKVLGGLKESDAQTVLKAIAGTPLAGDVTADLSPAASTSSTGASSPFGFDPLSLGQAFSQTLAPWLATQQQASQAGINADVAAMQKALAGVSPQLQGAYAAAIPSLKAAEDLMNASATQAVATAPEYDALVQGLTNAVNTTKGAQQALAILPYIQAQQSGGAVNAAPGSQTSNIANWIANAQKSVTGQH